MLTQRVQLVIVAFEKELWTIFVRWTNGGGARGRRRSDLVGVKDRRLARGDSFRPIAVDIDRSKDFTERTIANDLDEKTSMTRVMLRRMATNNLGLRGHDPCIAGFRPGDIDNAVVWPRKRQERSVWFIHDELFVQLMVEAEMMIAVDFEETPEFIA